MTTFESLELALSCRAKLTAFEFADAVWTRELCRRFGKAACNARYEPRGRGVAGSALAAAYAERDAARIAWDEARAARDAFRRPLAA